MSGPFGSSQFMYETGAAEEGQSLRFEDGDSTYLSWTPASAGNRKTWTYSTWIKRGNLGGTQLFGIGSGDSWMIRFSTSNKIACNFAKDTVTNYFADSTRVFRDTSAWYHIVVACDTTQSTASDRVKIYVNGELETITGGATTIPQNRDTDINVAAQHRIGAEVGNRYYSDGYIANTCFIDGQALDPTSFGEHDDTLWKPKSDADITSLTFGTNGFYLPFKQTTEAEGFSTVTYTGNGGTQSIEGVGFEPDFVWVKRRDGSTASHQLYDSVRGATKRLRSDRTESEDTKTDGLTSFDGSGFTLGSLNGSNASGDNYVAWCWDAGSGSAVSNTDGSITSSVKANTAKGFSIVSYANAASGAQTVGHGLTSAPEMVIVKLRNTTSNWFVYHEDIGNTGGVFLDATSATNTNSAYWNNTSPTSSVFSLGTIWNSASATSIAYCFHSVSGYSSIGSYTGTGAAGNSITGLGFKPAWIMIKKTNAAEDWAIYDNTRSPVNTVNKLLTANTSDAEATPSANVLDFDSDGFTIQGSGNTINTSGGSYIYMAFADTRDATFFGDTSGNGNNWTPNALNNTDVVPDSPVTGGNFATMNPLDKQSAMALSEGNLKTVSSSSSRACGSMTIPSTGKWLFEYIVTGGAGADVGLAKADVLLTSRTLESSNVINARDNNTSVWVEGTQNSSEFSSSYGTNVVVQVQIDMDAGTIKYKTASDETSALSFTSTEDWIPWTQHNGDTVIFNFGQDSSFAGNETPQGNTDDNGVGDFFHQPPSGFLALATSNLPAPTITAPDEYFNTVLYTGNGGDNPITGVGFQPDFVWIKERSGPISHRVFDAIRGAGNLLKTDSTDSEASFIQQLKSFDSDGFTVGTAATTNDSGDTYVGWSWKADGTGVSNASGSIPSTVSANTDAGFSVVSYTGNSTSGATVGHGLSSTLELILLKDRSGTDSWRVYSSETGGTKSLYLNLTNAAATDASIWNNTDPTSSVFTIGNDSGVNTSGNNYIAYCFHSVESYSKIGSYTGNGSTDGTFVHCGFRPAWIMIKRTDDSGNWRMYDNERVGYNVVDDSLQANLSNAEDSNNSFNSVDFTSNGFKLRGNAGGDTNDSASYIFLAFAEAPFKSANAR